MKFTADRRYANPEDAAPKILEIVNAIEPVSDGRIHIEKINGPFLKAGGSPAEYGAIERGYLRGAPRGSVTHIHPTPKRS